MNLPHCSLTTQTVADLMDSADHKQHLSVGSVDLYFLTGAGGKRQLIVGADDKWCSVDLGFVPRS